MQFVSNKQTLVSFRTKYDVIASKEGVPKRYFCAFGGKEYESIRQAFVACDD